MAGQKKQKAIGQTGDDIWQWQGRLNWECFRVEESRKMQQAHLLGKPGMDVWDRASVRELDFVNMRVLPGRQAIRFAPPPPPEPPAKKKGVVPPPLTKYVDEWHDDEGYLVQAQGLKGLVHPLFMDFDRPRFKFKKAGPELAHKEFVWQRALELCEDSADFIIALAEIYREELENEQQQPELPVLGTPHQTMAAFSLALYRSGASCCSTDAGRWSRPPGKNAKAASLPAPSSWRFSPKHRGVKKSVLGLSRAASLPTLTLPSIGSDSASTANSHKHVVFRLQDRSFSLKLIKAWEDWKELADNGCANGVPRFKKLDPYETGTNSFDWLLNANEPDTRILRIGGACATVWKALALCTDEPGRMAANLQLIQPSQALGGAGVASKRRYDIRVSPGLTAFEIAMMLLRDGKKAAAVLLCNGESIGGDFFNGHLTGLEEDILMRSDLYLYLREASHQADRRRVLDAKGRAVHIPESGCLLCKNVRVFRDTAKSGYAELDEPVELPVVLCVSMRNLNPHQSCSAQSRVEIGTFDHALYHTMLRNKFEMLLKGAAENKIEVIALSDQGVKQLHNKPDVIGTAFGEALRKCRQKPPQIVLSGSSGFIAALKKTVVPQDDA